MSPRLPWSPAGKMPKRNRFPQEFLASAAEEARRALAGLGNSLAKVSGEALILVVPGRNAPELWVVVKTGGVDLEAIRGHLPGWQVQVETISAFREAWRAGDSAHRQAVKKHLYVLGPRRLLSELLASGR